MSVSSLFYGTGDLSKSNTLSTKTACAIPSNHLHLIVWRLYFHAMPRIYRARRSRTDNCRWSWRRTCMELFIWQLGAHCGVEIDSNKNWQNVNRIFRWPVVVLSIFWFSTLPGEMIHLTHIFPPGLVQPPTSQESKQIPGWKKSTMPHACRYSIQVFLEARIGFWFLCDSPTDVFSAVSL